MENNKKKGLLSNDTKEFHKTFNWFSFVKYWHCTTIYKYIMYIQYILYKYGNA